MNPESSRITVTSPAALEAEIKEMVMGYVGTGMDVNVPLAAQGLDSLAAMELRQKLQVPSQSPRRNQFSLLCCCCC